FAHVFDNQRVRCAVVAGFGRANPARGGPSKFRAASILHSSTPTSSPFWAAPLFFFDLQARGLPRGSACDAHRQQCRSDRVLPDGSRFNRRGDQGLSRLARDHARLGSARYYDVRDKRFNPQRVQMQNAAEPSRSM
ncbi:MAG: hypothetical protein ACHBNF_09250, partial [Chromatiales bacterium]